MLIAERPEKDVYSQHTQVWAILAGTVHGGDAKSMMEEVMKNKELIQSTIYFKFYVARALQKVGLGYRYFELLKPWKYMLNQGMTTFGETDIDPRSDCHGWSATPCFDFIHTIAGIQPASPGFDRVIIAPNMGELTHIDVNFAHPRGMIQVHLKKDESGKLKGDIVLPDGMDGVFEYSGYKKPLKSKTKICVK